MFFITSKILWFLATPVNLLIFCLGLAVILWLLRWRRAAPRVAGFAAVALLALGFLPIGTLLLRPLEERFPQPPLDLAQPTGIIVLGGSTDEVVSDARNQVAIIDAATRITTAVALSRRFPQARLVFSGGSGALLLKPRTEAEDTRRLWIEMGVPADRITTEDRSRNTAENAAFTAALIKAQPGERWLLVTSAFHMPRAVGLFRAVGIPIVPYPVDYRTTGTSADLIPHKDATVGLKRTDVALREWVGLVAYRLTGRISDVFPGPR